MIRAAFRSLLRHRAPAATVLVILGLGLGASSAMLSVVRGVLVHSVPYPHEGQLVEIASTLPKQQGSRSYVSFPRFGAYAASARSLTGFAAFLRQQFSLTDDPTPVAVPGARVSPGFFAVLGVAPIRGREFSAEEQARGGPHAVIIGEGLWRARLGGAENILGKTLSIEGEAVPIVGVVPASFAPPLQDAEVFAPRVYEPDGVPPAQVERGAGYLYVVGRLSAGATPASALGELLQISKDYRARLGEAFDAAYEPLVIPLSTYLFGEIRASLLFLWAAGTLVFLIACANAGNVLLARFLDRRAELDVRAAVGATRRQLVLHLLAECGVLAVGGIVIGLLVALGVRLALAPLAAQVLTTNHAFAFDFTVFAFAAALGSLAVLLAGAVPALQATADHRSSLIAQSARGSTAGMGAARWRRALVVAQLAVSFALLALALQQAVALLRVQRLDRGFDPDGLLTFQIAPSASKYPDFGARLELYRRAEEQLARMPGFVAAGASQAFPVGDDQTISFIPEAEHDRKREEWPLAQFRIVTTGYLAALGAPMRRGRAFSAADTKDAPSVAVVNEALARRAFGGGDPVGKRVYAGGNPVPKQIIGVLADVRQKWLDPEPQAELFVPAAQMPIRLPPMYFLVRSRLAEAPLVAAIRTEVAAIDPAQPVTRVRAMRAAAAEGLAVPRMRAILVVGFAVLGTLLAAVGLWSVMSQLVAERTRELGIRMALGASPSGAMWIIVRTGVGLSTVGLGAGLVAAIALGRLAQRWLAGIEPPGAVVLVGAGVLLLAIGVAAAWAPARRAAGLEPLEAMR